MRITKRQGDYSGGVGCINVSKLGLICCMSTLDLAWWLSGKESVCQCRRLGFDSWVGKILWKRKEMTTHSSILCWEIPGTEEPGGLQSMKLDMKSVRSSVHEVHKESDMAKRLNSNKVLFLPQ